MSDVEKEQNVEKEKFLKVREAIEKYKKDDIEKISEKIIERFLSDKRFKELTEHTLNLPNHANYGAHEEGVFRHLIRDLIGKEICEGDELNEILYGLVFEKVMAENQDLNKFLREYIKKVQSDDSEAWNKRHSRDELREYHYMEDRISRELSPDYYQFNQGKAMTKYILGEK
ncbi:hypothetical protein KKD57_06955 [Patescibacteria group bacterium]|nr:hypothetical protein [Patescibacteria group bacterium]